MDNIGVFMDKKYVMRFDNHFALRWAIDYVWPKIHGSKWKATRPQLDIHTSIFKEEERKTKKKTKWNWLTLWWLACHLHSIFLYKWKRGMVWCLVLNSWVEKGKGSKNGVHVLDIFMFFVKLKIMYARYLIAFCGMVFMSVFFFFISDANLKWRRTIFSPWH